MFAFVVRWLLHRLVDRVVRRAETGVLPARVWRNGHPKEKARSSSTISARRALRARTMGTLLKSIISAVVFTVLVIMVLAELGYNIAPILAGAGVLGVAVGFGSQSLVKDFLSGVFMLVEDQYGVGDVVDLGRPPAPSRRSRCGSRGCATWTAPSGTSATARSSGSAT